MPTSGRFETSGLMRGDVRAEILAFDDVSVGYGREIVLHDLTFNVRRGEVAGLVALDGRGKSTLVRCAAGLLAPARGRVLYEERDIYSMSFAEDQRYRARTAVVFEGGALFQNRSILDNVSLPLRYHVGGGADDASPYVRRLLERVGYNESLTAFPWQVSARGRRLAALARALVREPELVVVDRFFEALESHDVKHLMELVLELNVKNGTSFLLVGELMPTLFQVAERVVVLEGGRLLAHGFKRALYKNERIKAAFETGAAALDATEPAPGAIEAAEPLPTGSEGFDPNASDSDLHPVIVTPDPDISSADEIHDSDADAVLEDDGRTMTLPPEAAAAVIAEARRRADERIEAEARKLEESASAADDVKGVFDSTSRIEVARTPESQVLDRKTLEAALRLTDSDAPPPESDENEPPATPPMKEEP